MKLDCHDLTFSVREASLSQIDSAISDTDVIARRGGWRGGDDLREAASRSTADGELMSDHARGILSYVIAEPD